MVLNYLTENISFSPFRGLFSPSWVSLKEDFRAAIAVAFLTFPQAMAYALVAGLPLQCGLLSATYSAIAAALFGSSRHLVTGPSNAIAILIQSGTAAILFTYYRDLPDPDKEIIAVQVLTQITLLIALVQVLVAWLGLGRLMQFVSYSVVIGYITGATLAMILGQIYVFLGIDRMEGVHSLYEHGMYLITHMHFAQLSTSLVGAISLLLLIILKRFKYSMLAPIICFALAGVLVEILGLSSYSSHSGWISSYFDSTHLSNVPLVGDNGDVNMLLPNISFPFFNMRLMNGVLPIACAIAMLSMMETISVAKSIAANSGQRLCINQEIFGVGMGNLLSAFMGGMPISGSPSRSGLNYRSGAQTRYAVIFSGLGVVIVVALLGFLLTRIPLTSLAALLLVTAGGLINKKHILLCGKATNADAFVLWSTLLSCIFLSLDIAFYIGIALSILLYLKKAAVPQLVEYEITDSGDIKPVHATSATAKEGIRVIKVEGELFFGAADLFQNTLKTFAADDDNTRVIILQLKNARDIDATTCLALEQLYHYLKGSQRYLIACGLTPPIWEVLSSSGLVSLLKKDNLFLFDPHHPKKHIQQAIAHARSLLQQPLSTQYLIEPAPEPQPLPLSVELTTQPE